LSDPASRSSPYRQARYRRCCETTVNCRDACSQSSRFATHFRERSPVLNQPPPVPGCGVRQVAVRLHVWLEMMQPCSCTSCCLLKQLRCLLCYRAGCLDWAQCMSSGHYRSPRLIKPGGGSQYHPQCRQQQTMGMSWCLADVPASCVMSRTYCGKLEAVAFSAWTEQCGSFYWDMEVVWRSCCSLTQISDSGYQVSPPALHPFPDYCRAFRCHLDRQRARST